MRYYELYIRSSGSYDPFTTLNPPLVIYESRMHLIDQQEHGLMMKQQQISVLVHGAVPRVAWMSSCAVDAKHELTKGRCLTIDAAASRHYRRSDSFLGERGE